MFHWLMEWLPFGIAGIGAMLVVLVLLLAVWLTWFGRGES
jgi:hypothetical protein